MYCVSEEGFLREDMCKTPNIPLAMSRRPSIVRKGKLIVHSSSLV